MREVYNVYVEEAGEIEGMFDAATKEFLGGWYCNDANWRAEYFDSFMRKVGVRVVTKIPAKVERELKRKLIEEMGG